MNLLMHNQALLRGILAGAVVLSGASACSRSDRAGTVRDTTQSGVTAVTPSDTQTSAGAAHLSGAATQQSDTATTTTRDTATATAQTPRQRSTPSRRRTRPDTTVKSGEESVSGYRGMERGISAPVSSDSSVSASPDSTSAEMAGTGAASPLDSAGETADYALTADSSTAGYSEMAPDTSSAAQRSDTAVAVTDTTAQAKPDTAGSPEMARDTSSAAGLGDTATVALSDTTAQAPSDTASIKVPVDSTTQAQADTTTVHTDTLAGATADSADTASAKSEQATAQVADADTLQDNAGRIRPPEDSTEIPGNVTSDQDRAEATSRDAAGAAAVGNAVTGIDAVSLMSRAGVRCVVKDESSDAWWDMADSPAALNPCGTGAMTLSLVRTGEK